MIEGRMGFMEHLRELRRRVRNAALAYLAAVIVAYLGAPWFFVWLTRPLVEAWPAVGSGRPTLHFKSVVEPLFVNVKIALIGGIFLASPVIFHQLWRFVAPGLYPRERRAMLPFVLGSVVCFVGGAGFGYVVVFPVLFKFLLGFANSSAGSMQDRLGAMVGIGVATPIRFEPTLMMEEYLGLAAKTLIGFGLCFELPVFLVALGLVGIVDHRALLRFSRYAVLIIFVVSAIITPDPTATTMTLLAVPLVGLYYLGVLLVFLFGRRRAARTAEVALVIALLLGPAAIGCGSEFRETPLVVSAAALDAPERKPSSAQGTLLGTFDLRFYWVADEHEAPGGPVEALCDSEERTLALVSDAFARRCRLEGTCRLEDGRLLNASRACGCPGGMCFRVLSLRAFPWGKGTGERALVPFRSVAVDLALLPAGTRLYAPEIADVPLPGPGGGVHDGCLVAADAGGNIEGLEMDLFVGRRRSWLALRQELPERLRLYVDSPRCGGEQGARAAF
ncbi:MAG: twin-arginine translocase subunit TatC [Myxococcota bacterium]